MSKRQYNWKKIITSILIIISIIELCYSNDKLSESDSIGDYKQFETEHLPLSGSLLKSFSKIKVDCLIIINRDINVVLHEKNSKVNLPADIFSNIVDEITNDKKELSLYNVCCIINNYVKMVEKPNLKIYVLKTKSSKYGCAFSYRNTNSCEFLCVLYGLPSRSVIPEYAKLISEWLDQFFIYRVAKKGDFIVKVPVLYGDKEYIDLETTEDQYIILSKEYPTYINKKIKYRTVLPSPINIDDYVGSICYHTVIFSNPIIKSILSTRKINKANQWKIIKDSFKCLIFGPKYYISKQNNFKK